MGPARERAADRAHWLLVRRIVVFVGKIGRITALSDLPSDRTLSGYIKKAAALNDKA